MAEMVPTQMPDCEGDDDARADNLLVQDLLVLVPQLHLVGDGASPWSADKLVVSRLDSLIMLSSRFLRSQLDIEIVLQRDLPAKNRTATKVCIHGNPW